MVKCTGKRCPMQVEYDVANCQCEDCSYRTMPMTEHDRIKNMSIEEMADFLAEHITNYRAPREVNQIYENAIDNITGKGLTWIAAFKKWLESEVTEE